MWSIVESIQDNSASLLEVELKMADRLRLRSPGSPRLHSQACTRTWNSHKHHPPSLLFSLLDLLATHLQSPCLQLLLCSAANRVVVLTFRGLFYLNLLVI